MNSQQPSIRTTAQGGRPTRRFILAHAVDVDTTPDNLGEGEGFVNRAGQGDSPASGRVTRSGDSRREEPWVVCVERAPESV